MDGQLREKFRAVGTVGNVMRLWRSLLGVMVDVGVPDRVTVHV
jgi:hypothetical protein